MSKILATAAALPDFFATKEQVIESGLRWLKDQPQEIKDKFLRLVNLSKTESRTFVVHTDEVIKERGFAERAAMLHEYGVPLGKKALASALEKAKMKPEELDVLCFTSCSCPTIPAIDTQIIQELGLRSTIKRVPVFQYGCAGGVSGLGLANELASQGLKVALVSVELCSLVFQPKAFDSTQLVAAALFADGAGAVILGPSYGPKIVDHGSFLIPNTTHLMGYNIHDDGLHLRLSKELPETLLAHTDKFLNAFLEKHSLTTKDINWWLVHPGGIKILRAIEQHLGFAESQMRFSYEVLKEIGNVSSASVLLVLNKFLNCGEVKNGDKALMFGIGPGLTLEAILLEV